MNFNFNSISEQNFSSASGSYLRPYDIYTVNLTKIEKTELKGSKNPNAVYPIVTLEFTECSENKGKFTTNLFIPTKDEDLKRPVYTNNEGHEYEGPSSFENFQFTLMQIVHELNPSGEEKIKANASKIKTVDQFIDLIIKALEGKNNVETKLKLVGRNSNGTIYAALPRACAINKNNEIYARKFIGNNLSFDNYELTQMKNYQNAKPTNMSSVDNNPDEKEEELDLDGLEL